MPEQTRKLIPLVNEIHGGLAKAGSETVNEAAEIVNQNIRKEIKSTFVNRNKYTENSIRTLKSSHIRSTGAIRPITGINARVVSTSPYLGIQEDGGTVHSNTEEGVMIPSKEARISRKHEKRIKKNLRLKRQLTQSNVRKIGRGKSRRRRIRTINQFYAVMYAMYGRGDIDTGEMIYFKDPKRKGSGVYLVRRGKVVQVRSSNRSSVKIKKTGFFLEGTQQLSQGDLNRIFEKNLQKQLDEVKL